MSAQVDKTGKQQNMGENGVPRADDLNITNQRNVQGKKGLLYNIIRKKKTNTQKNKI